MISLYLLPPPHLSYSKWSGSVKAGQYEYEYAKNIVSTFGSVPLPLCMNLKDGLCCHLYENKVRTWSAHSVKERNIR